MKEEYYNAMRKAYDAFLKNQEGSDELDKAFSDFSSRITSNGTIPPKGSYKIKEDGIVASSSTKSHPTKLEQLLENSQAINNCSLDVLNRLESVVYKLNGMGENLEDGNETQPSGLLDRISHDQDLSHKTVRKISDLVGILEELL